MIDLIYYLFDLKNMLDQFLTTFLIKTFLNMKLNWA